MAFKDILVYVDTSRNAETRLDLAARLAAEQGAHLVGLHVAPPVYMPAYVAAQVGTVVMEAQKDLEQKEAEECRALFTKATERHGISAEWRAEAGPVDEVVSTHARYVDFAIVGQRDDEDDAAAAAADLAEFLVLNSGRPVLVTPYAGKFETVGKNVLVAWNASREATRAVNDAIPFLTAAKKVTILAINPEGGPDGHGDVPGADIALHLARHDVKAEATQIRADDIDVANMLLSRVADAGADLLVMGAYGRSRLRELIMGGASHDVLRHMTVPVLMSH